MYVCKKTSKRWAKTFMEFWKLRKFNWCTTQKKAKFLVVKFGFQWKYLNLINDDKQHNWITKNDRKEKYHEWRVSDCKMDLM